MQTTAITIRIGKDSRAARQIGATPTMGSGEAELQAR